MSAEIWICEAFGMRLQSFINSFPHFPTFKSIFVARGCIDCICHESDIYTRCRWLDRQTDSHTHTNTHAQTRMSLKWNQWMNISARDPIDWNIDARPSIGKYPSAFTWRESTWHLSRFKKKIISLVWKRILSFGIHSDDFHLLNSQFNGNDARCHRWMLIADPTVICLISFGLMHFLSFFLSFS